MHRLAQMAGAGLRGEEAIQLLDSLPSGLAEQTVGIAVVFAQNVPGHFAGRGGIGLGERPGIGAEECRRRAGCPVRQSSGGERHQAR